MLHTLVDDAAVTSDETFTALERNQEPEQLVLALKEFGFSEQDIAQATQTDVRTVRRWKTAAPGPIAGERIGQLRNVVLLLGDSDGISHRGIVYWLRHANRLLEDYPPLQVLGVGAFRSVREAALAFVDTEHGFDEPVPASALAMLRSMEQDARGARKTDGRRRLRRVS